MSFIPKNIRKGLDRVEGFHTANAVEMAALKDLMRAARYYVELSYLKNGNRHYQTFLIFSGERFKPRLIQVYTKKTDSNAR